MNALYNMRSKARQMMEWNYRVFREKDGDYTIREVFYDANGSIFACTENAVEPMGESLEELAQDLEWFREASTLPVLTLADIPRRERKTKRRDGRENLPHEQLASQLGSRRSVKPNQKSRQVTKRALDTSPRKNK
jgi:hypothetical protein